MSDSFDLGEPPQPATAQAYRVLARKYRPQRFSELIGQDAMVTTLGNAIKRDRLAHAFLMTGVRGVGKTSTARLIAKAMNCDNGPTIDPCGVCDPCVAIAEGRYIDVLEMDAASNTKVEQMRDLLDNVPYASATARFKIYIIDEVHMLSNSSFNALLKTLEEPPSHVKFIFATTEISKVPVTVLSRCQRFDLRRISSEMLANHFAGIVKAEGVEAEPEALTLIARAAEGSVRDGLSILDQAIAHAGLDGGDIVTGAQVREMLGLSDRGAVRHLFGLVLSGDAAGALSALSEQRDLGVDPAAVLRGLLDITHGTTLAKVGTVADPVQSAEEREALADWAAAMSFALLHRLWQMLLKGFGEVTTASDPHEAADMVLLRIIHASQLPDPGELAKKLEGGSVEVIGGASAASGSAAGTSSSLSSLPDFPALVALLAAKGKPLLSQQLYDFCGLISFAPPVLVINAFRPLPADFIRDVAAVLKESTGTNWQINLSDAAGAPTLLDQDKARAGDERTAILAQPIVLAAFEAFPDAELIDYEHGDKRSAA